MDINKIRIIVCGSRGFTDYNYFKQELDKLFQTNLRHLVIYSGCARGVDQMAIQYCKERNIQCEECPADWDTHGKSAGYIRNADMADVTNAVLAFWDNKSRGTKHMIDIANKRGLVVKIVNV